MKGVMTRNILLVCFFVLAISCTKSVEKETVAEYAAAQDYNQSQLIGSDYLIDNQHSYIGFRIKYFGNSPVRGRFDEFDGTMFYDSSNISSISATLSIDTKSINTGNETRDEDLLREGSWFDAKNHPFILFKSTQVLPRKNGEFDVIGEITLKGIKKIDTIRFEKPTEITKDWAGNDQVDFSGKMIINRQDFGVYGGDFWSSVMENGLTQLSDEVIIELDIHTRKPDYLIRYANTDSSDVRKRVIDLIRENGIGSGLALIDSLAAINEISSGALSTVGYTLNAWKMYDDALAVFQKRLSYFPDKTSVWNQLAITNLYLGNREIAKQNFMKTLQYDSNDSRAKEYLRLMAVIE